MLCNSNYVIIYVSFVFMLDVIVFVEELGARNFRQTYRWYVNLTGSSLVMLIICKCTDKQ